MIGLQGYASRSESNRSVPLFKLASQRTTKALIRLCVSWFTFEPEHDKTNKMTRARSERLRLGIRTV